MSMNQGKLEVFKQEMARVNINILGIHELKWTRMGKFNSDDHYTYYYGQQSLRKNGLALIVHKRIQMQYFSAIFKMTEWSLFISKGNQSISQGGKREEGSGWGTRVYLWQIHGDIWQNQYNIVKLKKKKNLPAMQEMWVQSPCWDNPLEEEMAGHFSSFAWMIPWTEKPGRL